MEIHRCRFVPYPPSPINALAFSHTSSAQAQHKAPADLRLAVGRANGDIELWNPLQGTWVYETTFKGGKDRSIEGLAWVQDPDEADEHGRVIPGRLRLFSIGDSTYVTEWDLDHGRPLRHSSGNYGEIWCLAAQPRGPLVKKSAANGFEATSQEGQDQGQGQDLAVGCADGAIILLSTADNDLKFKRALSRPSAKKARVLSLTFQGRHMIIAGCADSTIRIIDAQAGRLVRNMSLGAGPSGGPREILVWA
ncbi:MAG: U3 small nucleolar RNA-associated protein, partial [Thelocarpon superellum]